MTVIYLVHEGSINSLHNVCYGAKTIELANQIKDKLDSNTGASYPSSWITEHRIYESFDPKTGLLK